MPYLFRMKIKIFDNIWSESVLRTIRKGKVTMLNEGIPYEMTTELQLFI